MSFIILSPSLNAAHFLPVILVEPDGTFSAHDIEKFLAYSNDFDFVIGSRTSKEMIHEGANMGKFLKWEIGHLQK